ncbi:TolC family protein [Lacinutrix sp. Bg11-31]|uniref:TolC family protein n=1 Tax=Lacinutrix sp. Bg11-31 TaxID=2057808 RepID=UPI000C30FB5E|nr:TolC family protein [Lacinutrix sp. Bg11-31]AUC82646.1 transporter [Lacinutrix sp. Bg11-31]
MRKILILFSFIISTIAYGQETKTSFSLQEAIDYALENNRESKNATLNIDSAKAQQWETIANGLPQMGATIDYINNIKQQFKEPVDFGDDGIIDFGAKQSVNANVTVNQLIFDGSYLVGLQASKVFLEISRNSKEKTDLEIRKAVINAYGNVLLTKESISILKKNISILKKNLNDITKIFENGLEEEESVEQIKITLSGVKSNLNNVIRLQGIGNKMLNITLGKDINDVIITSDSLDTLAAQNITITLFEISDDVKNTIDFKIADNDKRSKELLVKLEKSKALPTVGAFISGGYLGNSQKFTFLNNNQQWVGTANFGARITIPIFGVGLQSARTQRAKINLNIAENNLKETEQQLKLKIASAKSEYQFAIEEYDNKKDNLRLAERIEKKNQTKFFEGIGSSFELRQAQTQLYTAQNQLLQTMLDVINKKAELETVLNNISQK